MEEVLRRRGEAVLAALLAFHLLFSVISALETYPPAADLPSYVAAAEGARWFFDTGVREPAFPALIRVLSRVTGMDGLAAGRTAAVLSTLALAVAVYLYARHVGGPLAALGAGLVFVSTPAIPAYAAHGDRGAFIALLLLGWTYTVFERRSRTAAGILGGLLLLSRLDLILPLLLGSGLSVVLSAARRTEARRQAAVLGLSLLLVAPYVAHLSVRYGDPLYPQSVHARFWANAEFVGRPGFPENRSDFRADPYQGGPISSYRYVFGMHRAPELVGRYAWGTARAIVEYLPRYAVGSIAFYILAGIGVFAAVRSERAYLPLLLPALLLPYAFIYVIDQVAPGSGVEARFTLHAAPFVHVLAGLGAAALLHRSDDDGA